MNTAAQPVASAPEPKGPPLAAAPAVPAPPPTAVVLCDNCGAPVPARYCGSCGQRREPPVHSLWHFSKVATEDLTHADSRLWRTLTALLFRPGRLTAEFLAGRRARYLPPVRLYLVLSVAFFLWASATPHSAYVLEINARERAAAVVPLAEEAGRVWRPASRGETREQRAERVCRGAIYRGPSADRMQPLLASACRRIVDDNGRALQEALLHNVPRAMFLFLPLLAVGMMLMYWWPQHYYVEHLLLLVHYHAFVFLLLPLAWALSALLPFAAGWVSVAITVYIPWYLYRSMRVVYAQGRWLTAGKLVLLSLFYLVSGTALLVLTSIYSALTL
ncbi:MAG TPA: DUF3667 domain-containing protein [Steroidobacteraceae bacterium]|nr:DUF3667 domain-containing protein [Steroidobacteraceae bacterium]